MLHHEVHQVPFGTPSHVPLKYAVHNVPFHAVSRLFRFATGTTKNRTDQSVLSEQRYLSSRGGCASAQVGKTSQLVMRQTRAEWVSIKSESNDRSSIL